MLKSVLMYTKPKNGQCDEVRKFLLEQEVKLQVRDIEANPLGRYEIAQLLKNFDLKHFLDTDSKIYKRNKIDQSIPERNEIIDMMVENNDLLRVPILVSGRLMTIGCNREKITEMLQIRNNGSNSEHEERPRPAKINRRIRK